MLINASLQLMYAYIKERHRHCPWTPSTQSPNVFIIFIWYIKGGFCRIRDFVFSVYIENWFAFDFLFSVVTALRNEWQQRQFLSWPIILLSIVQIILIQCNYNSVVVLLLHRIGPIIFARCPVLDHILSTTKRPQKLLERSLLVDLDDARF